MTPLEKCDAEMSLAWNGVGVEGHKAYLYMLWYTDWLRERALIVGTTL
jgi:hypothetical protein